MIVGCPHCFNRVLCAVGGPCPSCGERILQSQLDALEGFVPVTLDEGSAVPEHCYLCDGPRTRVLKVYVDPASGEIGIEDAGSQRELVETGFRAVLKLLIGLALGNISIFNPHEDPGMRVYVPTCERCQDQLRIGQAGGSSRSLTLLAHGNFQQRLEGARRRGKPS